ncbi:MAG: 50S ribosomal protein L24 [Candidatus Woesearchaeota archaeon]
MRQGKFSRTWKASVLTKKQRKYVYNAPFHIKSKFMSSHLSKDLSEKYGMRNIEVRKDDKVKIVRGQFKGKTGKISRADVKHTKIYVEGIELFKKDGSKSQFPIHPSKVIITELALGDKRRMKHVKKEITKKTATGGKVKNG